MIRFPPASPSGRPELGVGLDVPWAPGGFVRNPAGKDHLHSQTAAFLSSESWSHAFVSIQPRDRGAYSIKRYGDAFEHASQFLPPRRALHTTGLDLGLARTKDRTGLLNLVNDLVKQHGFLWVNEDLGLWTLEEKSLPYPLPPPLTDAGLGVSIRNLVECQEALDVPLLVEFPGFSTIASATIGEWDAYDFFRVLAEQADSPVTLDIGHLISWRHFAGFRGPDLLAELDRLPLAHCYEIHLSGARFVGDRFYDTHDGVLVQEQFELLEKLAPLCPNLAAITYEDPAIDDGGRLAEPCRASLGRLRDAVAELPSRTPVTPEKPAPLEFQTDNAEETEEALAQWLFSGGETPAGLRGDRSGLTELVVGALTKWRQPGVGTLKDIFSPALDDLNPEEAREIYLSFMENEYRAAGATRTLEDAFADALIRLKRISVSHARCAVARSVVRSLALVGEGVPWRPNWVVETRTGHLATCETEDASRLFVAAFLGERLFEAELGRPTVELLMERPIAEVAGDHRLEIDAVATIAMTLKKKGLLASG